MLKTNHKVRQKKGGRAINIVIHYTIACEVHKIFVFIRVFAGPAERPSESAAARKSIPSPPKPNI